MPLVVFALSIVLVAIALMPFMLVQRYRRGTARRRARRWSATLNVVGFGCSAAMFLYGAALTSFWVPNALRFSLAGFAGGCLLGIAGLMFSRWEIAAGALHYTPNRWLVLAITLVVTARLVYGFWRTWNAWTATSDYASWIAASGVAGSLAAGAVVLGYYFIYWFGVRRRVRRYT